MRGAAAAQQIGRRKELAMMWLMRYLIVAVFIFAQVSCRPKSNQAAIRTLQPGDQISLSGGGYSGPIQRYVNQDGTIDVPFLKRTVIAQGLTEQGTADAVNELFGEPNLFSVRRDGTVSASEMILRERVIGPGDLLAVTMRCLQSTPDEPRLLRRVGADGTIRLMWIGKFKIEGMTCVSAARSAEAVQLDTLTALGQTLLFEFVERAEQASIPLGSIRHGDTLEIRMWDIDAPVVERILHERVSRDGDVELPLIGRFKLAGLTDQEAEAALTKVYRDRGIVQRLENYVNRERFDPPPK